MACTKIAVIIVAGGSGQRMSGELPKQYLKIGNEPILRKTIKRFKQHPSIDFVQVAIGRGHEKWYRDAIDGIEILPPIYGGQERYDSVGNAIEALAQYSPDYVLIHDAARPFVSDDVIDSVLAKLKEADAVDLLLPIVDTLKKFDENLSLISREGMFLTQTPQGFKFDLIRKLHKIYADKAGVTDDISLCLENKIKVAHVIGDIANIKITNNGDLEMINKMRQAIYKCGFGTDLHRYDREKNGDYQIALGGVEVAYKHPIIAHSDGDVILHAITDAILGTIAAGDIGEHFPPSDPQWKDKDSSHFVKHANLLLKQKGGEIVNIDISVLAEKPKLLKYKEKMQKRIAEILEIKSDQVSLKATTTEKMGFIGREEGLMAQAVVMARFYEDA